METPPADVLRDGAFGSRRSLGARMGFALLLLIGAAFYILCLKVAQVDPAKFVDGLPRLAAWTARAWPPDFSELDTLLVRAAETVAMGTVGTSFAALLAVPVCIFAARNVTPLTWAYYPARGLLNILRGIDSFVFALIFVAAVGLGPFGGGPGRGVAWAAGLGRVGAT